MCAYRNESEAQLSTTTTRHGRNQKLQLPKSSKRVYNQQHERIEIMQCQCMCEITSSHDKTGFYLERGSDILALIK